MTIAGRSPSGTPIEAQKSRASPTVTGGSGRGGGMTTTSLRPVARATWGETASEQWQERVRRETPLGRWGTPQDVAAAARWLASPAAAYITGHVINVNGGMYM